MTTEYVRVGDVLSLVRRQVVPDPASEYELVGIYSFGKGIFHREPRPGAELGEYRFFEVRPGDLVLSNIQAWEGAIAHASEEDAGLIGTHRFLTYVPESNRIDTNWARWFFLSEPGMALIRKAAPGTTMRNRTLAIKRFEDLTIPLPPIEAQRRTVERLESIRRRADVIGNRFAARRPDDLEAALPAFVDEVISTAGSNYGQLGDLVDFVSDVVHPGDDPAPADAFVGLQHIESHTGRRVGSEPPGPMKGRKFRFAPGDILYGYLRPYLNKVWVADCHGLCSVDQYVLQPHPGVSAEVLAHILRGRAVLNSAIELTHSLQLPRLRSGLLASLQVPVIPPELADDLRRRLDGVRDLIVEAAGVRLNQMRLTEAMIPAALHEAFAPVT